MTGISFIIIAPLLIIIWAIYRFIVFKKNKFINIGREISINIFFLYFLTVIYLTFFKLGFLRISFEKRGYANLIPMVETINMFKNNYIGVTNAYYNVIEKILLFVPLGFSIPFLFKNKNKFFKVTLYGFLASISIEVIQYLTLTNTSDIDDIIFNTLGTIIGFMVFNIVYHLLKNTILIRVYNSISMDYKGSLLLISAKPIITMLLITSLFSFSLLYSTTCSGLFSTQYLAKEVFATKNDTNYVEATDFFNYKLFLYNQENYLEVRTATRVLNDRWTEGSSYKSNISDDTYGYSVMILDNDTSKGIVVYGRNSDAKMIEITFKGKKYSEPLNINTYFLVTFPTFEEIGKDSDLLNFYSTGESKDLNVDFIEEDGNECTHMKLIK